MRKWSSWFSEGEAVDEEGDADEGDDDPQEGGGPLLPKAKRTYYPEDIVVACGQKSHKFCESQIDKSITYDTFRVSIALQVRALHVGHPCCPCSQCGP